MLLGVFSRHRRFAGALAFLAMAFYVVLVPWHTLSQTKLQLSPNNVSTAPCHQVGDESNSPKPNKPLTKCPICNGFAALQIAVSAPACPLMLRTAEGDAEQVVWEDSVADSPARAPQSRGPPLSV